MRLPEGTYTYEIRDGARLMAIERNLLEPHGLSGERSALGLGAANRHQVSAELDSQGLVTTIRLNYNRGLFSRSAVYEAASDQLRGTVSAMAGRNAVATKLGRFREVDGDLVMFKALLIARVRERGQQRWTARVAVIDPATLTAHSAKHTYYQTDSEGVRWNFEPLIGERVELRLHPSGIVMERIDKVGIRTVLVNAEPALP